MPETHKQLLEGNLRFINETTKFDPDFFHKLSQQQTPQFLWIGCSDSRVPATEITGTTPGAIFVGRNIANVVVNTDLNLLSVVYYAVKVLKVKHIIVCGHYGCGGVKAAMSKESFGFLDNWLLNLKDIYRHHSKELNAIENESDRFDRFVELNVLEQARNLAKISFIQEEWATGEFPYIHSWVYRLDDGHIRDLDFSINSTNAVNAIYEYESKIED
uniref:carbonic anhydrase n=1 Tax=Roseivirga sp. TaxID=1964215 RepID=UPI0040479D0D